MIASFSSVWFATLYAMLLSSAMRHTRHRAIFAARAMMPTLLIWYAATSLIRWLPIRFDCHAAFWWFIDFIFSLFDVYASFHYYTNYTTIIFARMIRHFLILLLFTFILLRFHYAEPFYFMAIFMPFYFIYWYLFSSSSLFSFHLRWCFYFFIISFRRRWLLPSLAFFARFSSPFSAVYISLRCWRCWLIFRFRFIDYPRLISRARDASMFSARDLRFIAAADHYYAAALLRSPDACYVCCRYMMLPLFMMLWLPCHVCRPRRLIRRHRRLCYAAAAAIAFDATRHTPYVRLRAILPIAVAADIYAWYFYADILI